ncbi:MAG: glycoside hydrolase family 3 C-terminal domain-containing protein [Candidatus Brockarchaeota archaeon]|nr:glycoside hydrolase family 3 C-terminal domain-containing protein [Candidatus Brockarchaeota archaeon]
MSVQKRNYYVPPDVSVNEIYHEDWIDFNKNGVKDPFEDPGLPVEKRVEDLLKRMTLQEKLAQLRSSREMPEGGVGNLTHVTRGLPAREGAEKANQYQVKAVEKTRLGIPVIIHDECLHGCVAKFSTSFPQAIALAATWDRELFYRVSKAIARETRSRGIHQCLSPVVNIARDVRAGRTEESYGEDPYLTSEMGSLFCRAMLEEGVVATPKHFAANFVGDGGRDSNEIHFSERILREVYFPGFKACVKAGALSLMAAYNSLDGVPCSSNKWLLTQVLRDEWGFQGFVVSDYGSVAGIFFNHRVAGTFEEAAKQAVEAGLEVELPETRVYGEPLARAVEKRMIPVEVLDEAVRRVLRAKFLIGLFDRPFADPEQAEKLCNCEEHVQLALQAARESIVLLKNVNNTLPLNREKTRSIAVLGPASDSVKLGGYSTVPRYAVTPLEGIRRKAGPGTRIHHAKASPGFGRYVPIPPGCLKPGPGEEGNGLKGEYFSNRELKGKPVLTRVDAQVSFNWGAGSPGPGIPEDDFSVRWTGRLVAPKTGVFEIGVASDDGARLWLDGRLLIDSWRDRGVTLDTVTVRLEKGRQYDVKIEYYEHVGDAAVFLLWDHVDESTPEVKEAVRLAKKSDVAVFFAEVIEGEGKDRAVLNLPRLQEAMIEKIVETGTPTIVVLMTGSAVTGEWIKKVHALVQAWYPGQEGGNAIAEVLFGDYSPAGRLPFTWPRHVGQLPLYYNYKPSGRGYDYVDTPGSPLFPFGHGLSYTRFEYSNLSIEKRGEEGPFEIGFDVKNVGGREGDEVAQLYVQDPVASVARPVKELKGFQRVSLKPGETRRIVFKLTVEDLAFLGGDMRRIVEPGEFKIMVGASSEDIRLQESLKIERRIVADVRCVSIKTDRRMVAPGEAFTLTVKLRNKGPISDIVPVKVVSGGEELARRSVELPPGGTRDVKIRLKLKGKAGGELFVCTPGRSRRLKLVFRRGGRRLRRRQT